MGYLKDFLLNIFIIFSPLVLYPYIYKTKHKILLYHSLQTLLFIVILIFTMTFPININELTYDFRSIPVIIASLYGGPVVSVLLFCTLVIYRWVLGNPNTFIYILSILPSVFLVLFSIKKYNLLKTYQKVIVAFILCSLMKLLTFTIYLTLTSNLHMLADNVIKTIQTYMIQGIFIGVCVYFMEILIKYFYMQDEIHKSERIKMVSEMAASVAHEIRNPLTTVRGFIQLLASENVKSTEKEFYQKISLEELSRADQIISNYLSLAKAGNESIQLLNVAEEINYLENVLSTYANYNNIQIRTNHSDPNGLYYITGDKNKFRQALINIGKNAIEAMQNGGSLEIRMYELGERIFISIKDNGIGMTPEQINRLGTPYYSTKEKGTGLGTMVTFSIIKKMNGKIEIKSEKGKGTEYIISFPK